MPKLIDLVGKRYAELTVESLADCKIKNRPAWVCVCDCGERKIVAGDSLKSGDVKCCGKHKTKVYIEKLSARSKIQNRKYPKETDSHTRLYTLWRAMLWRCNNPSHEAYYRYGGSGITVHGDWVKYAAFREWAVSNGYRSDLTIDRIDNDKGYSPSNCRWVTPKAQAKNRKAGLLLIKAFGENKPLIDWVLDARCTVGVNTLRKRISAGNAAEFSMTASEFEARSSAKMRSHALKRGGPDTVSNMQWQTKEEARAKDKWE